MCPDPDESTAIDVDLRDAYISLSEALLHGGIHTRTRVNIHYFESQDIEQNGADRLQDMDGIVVPGGFGDRGVEGKIASVRYARENNIPYLGICLGMQVAVIEAARNLAGLEDAHSTEFKRGTEHPVVALITEWETSAGEREKRSETSDMGGTMRLGAQEIQLQEGSLAASVYGSATIHERHRHRYEVNNTFVKGLTDKGLRVTGVCPDGGYVEIVEVPDHPWYLACQFHPEFKSKPLSPHPLFQDFIDASYAYRCAKGGSTGSSG